MQKWRDAALASTVLPACLAFAAACGSSSAHDNATAASLGGGSTVANDAGLDSGDGEPVPDMLSFSPASTIKLGLKETRELTLLTTPPGSFRVRFALPGSGQDSVPGDAALNASEVQTGSDGIAHVTLTAPSKPATFNVRASVAGKVPTFVGVSVSARGYTTLHVVPSYSGRRVVSEWTATATAHDGADCGKLLGNPPPDGDLSVTAAVDSLQAAPPEGLDLEVPIGVDIAVTLRAGHYIGGCANLAALSEGEGNSVLVYASDRPLNLAATRLALSFGPTDAHPALDKLMKATVALAESALSPTATSDVGTLLDDMHNATPAASRDAFDAIRQQSKWDAALQSAFGKGAARRIQDPAQRWLSAGLDSFSAADTFNGQLTSSGKSALFTLTRVAQATPASAGFPKSFQTTWSTDSSDTLLLGSELTWVPSRLVTALATTPALLEFPEATSVENALALSVDCATVAKVLLVYGTNPGSVVYPGCDESCARSACAVALTNAWKRARDASGAATASLSVTASGKADVGDDAAITGLNGSWVGSLTLGGETAPVSGTLSATSK